MENEVMNYEEAMDAEIDVIEEGNEATGIGTGLAMLGGAVLALATEWVAKKAKKAYDNHKAKKELRLVDEHNFVEPTDEQINEVTQK